MIFESHAHYDDEAFDADREAILEQCQSCLLYTSRCV